MVHIRKIKNKTLTFIVSGRLWRNSLVMQDLETGSYWSHITGEALIGELEGEKLNTKPVVQTTWGDWKNDHPETLVLKKTRDITSSAYENYFNDPDRNGIFRAQWLMDRMPGKSMVIGVTDGPHALALKDAALETDEFIQTTLGENRVVVIRGSDGGVRAFISKVGDKVLSFSKKNNSQNIKDNETSSLWDLDQGACREGRLAGIELTELSVTAAFWFAWSSFYPNTRVIE